jgi:hypothetical protein
MQREEISKRAYPLDSRTVWVEQQIVRDCIVSRDNFPLGPGEYSPSLPVLKHVSTPKLGKRSKIAPYLNFNSGLNRASITETVIPFSKSSSVVSNYENDNSTRDHITIFHEHNIRQPLDPKLRFCSTPGPSLDQDSILGPIKSTLGINKPYRVLISANVNERNPTIVASNSYDIKYDSPVLRKMPLLGTIPKAKRSYDVIKEVDDQTIVSNCDRMKAKEWSQPKSISPLKLRKQMQMEKMFLDSSCYDRVKKPMPLDLNPAVINKLSKCNIYHALMTKPRHHRTKAIESQVTKTLKLHC